MNDQSNYFFNRLNFNCSNRERISFKRMISHGFTYQALAQPTSDEEMSSQLVDGRTVTGWPGNQACPEGLESQAFQAFQVVTYLETMIGCI